MYALNYIKIVAPTCGSQGNTEPFVWNCALMR